MEEMTTTKESKLAVLKMKAESGDLSENSVFLLQELEAAASDLKKAQGELEAARASLGKTLEAARASRHILTLWLAFRGSSTEEVFKATQGLAGQTVQVLNA